MAIYWPWLCAAVLLGPVTANAHKLKCFALAEGDAISGYAWFSGAGRARDVHLEALAPDGTLLFQGQTDENGEFSFPAKVRGDYCIKVATADGHAAQFVVSGADLPDSLPAEAEASGPAIVPAPPNPADEAPATTDSQDSVNLSEWEAAMDRVVARQIGPFRRELAEWREARRVQDIVGAVGYILGLTGIVFFLLARAKLKRASLE